MIEYNGHITVDEYNTLREAVGWGTCGTDKVRMAIERTDFLIVARIDGLAIGMARVIHDGLQALIMDVAVLPEHQGRGIGKYMMTRVMEFIDGLSKGGGIYVNLMSAKGKEGFYGRFGFDFRPDDTRGAGMTQFITRL